MTAPPPFTARRCATCGTELAASALACPACHALVHADRLRAVAAAAEAAERAGKLREARGAWEEALSLLPATTQQHAVITTRLESLAARIADADPHLGGEPPPPQGPWYKRWAGGVGAVAVLLLTKGKFLLLGLTKLPTLISMFGFFGVYWAAFGWPLALGLVVSIYIHEMGHVAALLRLGIRPSAPMFVPGLGAFVAYSKRVSDPREDAYVGLAGPIWGAGAGVAAFAAAKWTGSGTWLAIAELTGFINLFNLIPFFGLDGSHGIKVLNRAQRLAVVAAFAVAWQVSGVQLILLPLAVTIWRAFARETGRGDARTLANFLGLIAVLTWLAALKTV